MKTVGIIAEFNPFHNGHKYIIDQAKEKSGADKVIVVMSGAFTQRGTPAYMYKYDRVNCALFSGADLVLELPVSYSTATAEAFAFGGVTILNSIGVTDYLCFGSENGDLESLTQASQALINPDEAHSKLIRNALDEGLSFPAARSKAYPGLSDILDKPNNILAIEYLKSLSLITSFIKPITIQRIGDGFHETKVSSVPSAHGIRELVSGSKADIDIESHDFFPTLKNAVPESALEVMVSTYGKTWPVDINDFDSIIYYTLLSSTAEELSELQDMNLDLANKMHKGILSYTNADQFISDLKSKEITYSRISRALIHCLLKQKDYTRDTNGNLLPCPYTRILGFRKDSGDLLRQIQKEAKIPVITKAGDASKLLSPNALALFNQTLLSDRIYDFVLSKKYGTHQKDGCLISPVII